MLCYAMLCYVILLCYPVIQLSRLPGHAEAFPLLMSEQCNREFVEASEIHRVALRSDADTRDMLQKKRKSQAPAAADTVAGAQNPRFHRRRGIQELCKVKRLSTCMLCNGNMKKGSWKFSYAAQLNRAPVSIHVHCIDGMDREAATHSLQVVKALQAGDGCSDEVRSICADVVKALEERLETSHSSGVGVRAP